MKAIMQRLYRSAHVAGHAASVSKTWQRKVSGLAQDTAKSKSPSKAQLRAHALQSAVPMIGFGVVDCVVMTQVGSTMDAVLGARLGISSITAAAIGLFCSDSCGVLFGGTIESFAGRLGLPTANLTSEQLENAGDQTRGNFRPSFWRPAWRTPWQHDSTAARRWGHRQECSSRDGQRRLPLAFGRYSCDHDGGRCCCIFQTWLPVL